MTVADLFRSSLRAIGGGKLRPGQSPGASWTTDVLLICNLMLDAWNADRMMAWQIARLLFPLVPNQLNYKIGLGAPDWNVARPVRIENAGIVNLSAPIAVETPIHVMTDEEWARETMKSGNFTPIPSRMYMDRGNPIATITPLDTCNAANQITLYVWTPLVAFVNLTDTVSFPPGYGEAIRYNLAVRVALEWDRAPSPFLVSMAESSLARIASINAPSPVLRTDPAITSMNRPGFYDWISNTFIR